MSGIDRHHFQHQERKTSVESLNARRQDADLPNICRLKARLISMKKREPLSENVHPRFKNPLPLHQTEHQAKSASPDARAQNINTANR